MGGVWTGGLRIYVDCADCFETAGIREDFVNKTIRPDKTLWREINIDSIFIASGVWVRIERAFFGAVDAHSGKRTDHIIVKNPDLNGLIFRSGDALSCYCVRTIASVKRLFNVQFDGGRLAFIAVASGVGKIILAEKIVIWFVKPSFIFDKANDPVRWRAVWDVHLYFNAIVKIFKNIISYYYIVWCRLAHDFSCSAYNMS